MNYRIIADLSAEQIVDKMIKGDLPPLDELKKIAADQEIDFGFEKQKQVKKLLNDRDEMAFAAANTLSELEEYLSAFSAGNHVGEAEERIRQMEDDDAFAIACDANTEKAFQTYLSEFPDGTYADEAGEKIQRIKMLEEIRKDINEYTPGEIKLKKLNEKDLDDLCEKLGIDVQRVINFREPNLRFSEKIPQKENDIPKDYTDVFFWGISSSGKTCALSAILSTMKQYYAVEQPDCPTKFGATYRDSLIEIFLNKTYGYLPGRTAADRTQYMPFLFYQSGDTRKRRISFFELSGEVFKYFYEKVYETHIIEDQSQRDTIVNSFQTLELLLNSNNRKIHFFFIDYNQETKHTVDDKGLTQSNYLEAAATYFRDTNDILKDKTDAVYVVVTKSDEIQNRYSSKKESVDSFLAENFGSFMRVLRKLCHDRSVEFHVEHFSIGKVYFKQICKIDRTCSQKIIKELLYWVKPESGIFRRIGNR